MNDPILGGNAVFLAIAAFIILCIFLGVRIVPQSEKHVVERFGRLRAVLGPGINFVVPFLDRVPHKISILERQLPNASQDAITADNVLVKVETSVFYRITEPEKTVYRIRDVDAAIATTVAGIVRSEIGKLELDQVQSGRAQLIERVREQVRMMVDDWGVEVTRAEILDVNLDDATRAAMLQQLNAERARRAQVMEAEGKKRAVELAADADLYAAEQAAKAKRVTADAEAYATGVIAGAITANGLEAAQYQIAMKQVEALAQVAVGEGKQTILLPANALEAFSDAFKLVREILMWWSIWWVWVVAGFLIGGLEILAPGYIFLGFAIGAVTTGVFLGFGILSGGPAFLLLTFALCSLVAWFALRKTMGIRENQVKVWDRDINDN